MSKVDQVTQATETIVLDALASAEEQNGRVCLDLDITTESLLDIAVHFTNVDLSFHLASHALPVWCQVLAVRTPGSVELDEPRVVGHGH